eukprot:comp22442_c0_seq1/m.33704 comp22442_c0_seq1/g.33704  ORF comp22442_c0_seq1/g.33704 comp22442_c0_seq1/m.33704 type:complete len:601 (-) comp22442_c0_seq1:62-1864(-)
MSHLAPSFLQQQGHAALQGVTVMLFHNDGLMDTEQAKVFYINPSWDIQTAAKECAYRLYGRQIPNARLFDESGREFRHVDYIQRRQAVVVSTGENFVRLSYSFLQANIEEYTHQQQQQRGNGHQDYRQTDPTALDINLRDLVSSAHQAAPPMDSGFMLQQLQVVEASLREEYRVAVSEKMPPSLLTEALKAVGNVLGEVDPTVCTLPRGPLPGGEELQSLFNAIDIPVMPLPLATQAWYDTIQSGRLPDPQPLLFANSSSTSTSSSPISDHTKPTLVDAGVRRTSDMSAMTYASTGSDKLADSDTPGNSQDEEIGQVGGKIESSMGISGGRKAPYTTTGRGTAKGKTTSNDLEDEMAAKKIHLHRASEQRCRHRLNVSIKELVLTVPALSEIKNPTKATIIQKTSEFVKTTKNAVGELSKENDELKKELIRLTQELEAQKSRQVSRIPSPEVRQQDGGVQTVEILGPDFTYLFVDYMWEIVMGFSRHEVVNRFTKDLVGCKDCPVMLRRCNMIKNQIGAGITWNGLVIGKRRDGRAFSCQATITPVVGAEGGILQYVYLRRNVHLLQTQEEHEEMLAAVAADDLAALRLQHSGVQAIKCM